MADLTTGIPNARVLTEPSALLASCLRPGSACWNSHVYMHCLPLGRIPFYQAI